MSAMVGKFYDGIQSKWTAVEMDEGELDYLSLDGLHQFSVDE